MNVQRKIGSARRRVGGSSPPLAHNLVAGSVLKVASARSEIDRLEVDTADQIQQVVNHYFWTKDATNRQVELVLKVLALKSFSNDLHMPDLENWHLGYIRFEQNFGSGRTLLPGDVVICCNMDADGDLCDAHYVWAPRLIHVGLVPEDDIDPM